MELGIEPAKEHYTLRDYIAVMYRFIWNLTDNELMLMGHNKKEGKNRLGLGIEMIDMLADYSEEAAEEEFWDFMDTNFPLKLNTVSRPDGTCYGASDDRKGNCKGELLWNTTIIIR